MTPDAFKDWITLSDWALLTPEERWDYRCEGLPADTGCEMCGFAEGEQYYAAVAAKHPAAAAACHSSASGDAANPVPVTVPLPGLDFSYVDGSAAKPGNAWFKVCQWQALAELPEMCAGDWTPAPPAPPGPPATTLAEYNCDCERHAYCSTVDRGNRYVAAFTSQHIADIDQFKWRETEDEREAVPDADPKTMHTGNDMLWKELAYWCSADVLEAIESGTYERVDSIDDTMAARGLAFDGAPPLD